MQLGTGFWLWAGLAMLAIGSGLLLWNLLKAISSPIGSRLNCITWMLLALYPMGVGFKSAVIGPDFVRYHLSDIGFPVFVGLSLYFHFRSGFEKNNDELGKDPLADTAQALRHRKGALLVGLGLSYGYEVFTGWLWSLRPDMKPWLVGDFDWWDIVNYTLGAALCYLVLRYWSRLLAAARVQHAEATAALEVAIRRERRERRRQQPKKKRPGRKGGRR